MPEFTQRSYFGGIGDDEFAGLQNGFYRSKNVEIRKNPYSLTLSKGTTLITTATDPITCMLTLQDGVLLAFTNNGKVYRKLTTETSFTEVFSDETIGAFVSCIEYNGYVIVTSSTKLHRITSEHAVGDGTFTSTNFGKDFRDLEEGQYYPMIEVNNSLYIGVKGGVQRLNNGFAIETSQVTLEIFADNEPVGMTFFGQFLRIYAKNRNDGRSYLWNPSSGEPLANETIEWRGLPIHAVTNIDGQDYVVAGQGDLFVTDGYSHLRLKKPPVLREIKPNGISAHDSLIYWGIDGVYTWGKLNVGYTDSLNKDFDTSNNVDVVHTNTNDVYFTIEGAIYQVNQDSYQVQGYVDTFISNAGNGGFEKKQDSIKIGFKPLKTGESIRALVKKDYQESFVELFTVDSTHPRTFRDVWKPFGDFSAFQLRVELNGNGTSTPTLTDLFYRYSFIGNK